MRTRGLAHLAAFALLALGGACADPNVAACESWHATIVALPCVPNDADLGIDCSLYEDYPCDATEYFECLENSYSCSEDGVFQPDHAPCVGLAAC
jgi:hypothetical protein